MPRIPIDETGNIYGCMKVVERAEAPSTYTHKCTKAYWLCECIQCGKQKVYAGTRLRTGKFQCGFCNRVIDITGNKYGHLTVLRFSYKVDEGYTSRMYWYCICECGGTRVARADHLKSGSVISCGCKQKYEWEGKRFGLLTVIKILSHDWRTEKPQALCVCDCGREITTSCSNLGSGNSQSCGCTRSPYERRIKLFLDKREIEYIYNYWDHECRNIHPLQFDFVIGNVRIEYQGKHHYEPMRFKSRNGEEELKRIQLHDQIKRDYCREKGIPYLEIPYYAKNKMRMLKRFLTENNIIPSMA